MEKHKQKMFAGNVEEQQNATFKKRKRPSIIDPDIELQIQKDKERKRWLAANIDEDDIEDWKALNISPKNAVRWKKTGLSYNTIAVLLKQDVTPSEALAFISQKFDKRPVAFGTFAAPLYDMEDNCHKVLKVKDKNFNLLKKSCKEYTQRAKFNAISGHMADRYEDTDLSLEYISKLRQMDSQKVHIAKLLIKQSDFSIVNDKAKQYELLFPMVDKAPTKEEMYYVVKNKLNVKHTNRYKSNQYYSFWVNKEKSEERARIRAIKQQKALKVAKVRRLKAEAYRMKALAYNKMVASECGDIVTTHPSTGEKVHVEGKVQYYVGKVGSNVFAYVVKNKKDGKNYLVRDPENVKKVAKGTYVSWIALTVGRVVSVTIEEDGTASYNHYEDETQQYFPLLKYAEECQYRNRALVKR